MVLVREMSEIVVTFFGDVIREMIGQTQHTFFLINKTKDIRFIMNARTVLFSLFHPTYNYYVSNFQYTVFNHKLLE